MSARTDTLRASDGADLEHRSRSPWGAVVAVLVVALVLVGAYVGAAYALADRVPFNTTVAGVDIGGMTSAAAVERLDGSVGEEAREPVAVSLGADVDTLDPADAGLEVDVEETVANVTGFSLDPRRLWRHLTGAGRLPVVTDTDEVALRAALEDLAERTDVAPRDGEVTISGASVSRVEPREGQALDVPAAADAVRSMWLSTDGPVPLPVLAVPVDVSTAEVDEAVAAAEAALAEPLVVVVGDREVALRPEVFGDTLAVEPDGTGGLGLTVDGEALREAALAADEDLESSPRDATVVLSGGRPEVVPGQPGRVLEAEPLAEAALAALAADGDRRAVVEGAVVEPDLTTEEAEALGIREVVSTFSTPYPANEARTTNLRVAARTISGTLLLPGEVFDLNAVLGERTTAKGYRPAGVISNGVFREGVGGGVSQVSTTTYNAAFFAGLEVLDFQPHSYYISRYPEGRESTLNFDPPIDMRFRNDTDTGILVQAGVGGGEITVTFWGTKTWDVESVTSPRRDIRQGGVRYDDSPDCTGQAANTGFTVDTTRIWKDLETGEEVKRETNTWRYSAGDRIICGEDPDA